MPADLTEVIALYLLGAVATAGALVLAVVSIAGSIRSAKERPELADTMDARRNERRIQLIEPLEQRERDARAAADSAALTAIEDLKREAEAQIEAELQPEYDKHGMIPSTWDNAGREQFFESIWQMKQTLRPQVLSAVLLVIGTGFETWASIWALFLTR